MSATVVVAAVCAAAAIITVGFDRRPRRGRAGRLVRPAEGPRPGLVPVAVVRAAVDRFGSFLRVRCGCAPDLERDRVVGTSVVVAVAASMVHPVLGLAVGVAAWAIPLLRRRALQRAQGRAVVEALPDVVDLFRLACAAGFTVHESIRLVGTRVDGGFRPVLGEICRRTDLGVRLADALGLLLEMGEPVRPLTLALISAERDGAALAPSLQRAADESRLARRRLAEEQARKLPVQLLFPLVLCILPAFALLTVVPILAGILRSFEL